MRSVPAPPCAHKLELSMRHPIPFALALMLALILAMSGAPVAASGGGAGELHLVPMDEVSVPIIDGDRTDGKLEFKLVLEARNEEAAQQLTAALPVLRAATVGAGIEFARLYASPMMPLDARRLASEMTAALQAQDARVARVLLVEVIAART